MGRYMRDVVLNKPLEMVMTKMEEYLFRYHFHRTDWQGEPVYVNTDNNGKNRYFKYSYVRGILHIEAWFKNLFNNESNLKSIFSGAGRKEYEESLDHLVMNLSQPTYAQAQNGEKAQSWEQAQNREQAQSIQIELLNGNSPRIPNDLPIQVPFQLPRENPALLNNSTIATNVLIFGILSVCLAFVIPFISIFFGCYGLIKSKLGEESSEVQKIKAGKICCIIGLALSIIVLLFQMVSWFIPFTHLY